MNEKLNPLNIPIPKICGICGGINPYYAKYCGDCGSSFIITRMRQPDESPENAPEPSHQKLLNQLTIVNFCFRGVRKMKSKHHKHKSSLLFKLYSRQGLFFHLAGIVAIIWFLVRVLPKPDRMYYPCQQMGISVAFGYIVFWSLIWTAIFHGLGIWVRKMKYKTAAYAPVILVSFVLIFSISSGVYANLYIDKKEEKPTLWEPIPNEPIGIGQGVNPGRVVWVWDPDATEADQVGFWWQKDNNNQEVIEEMFSEGIQNLADAENDEDAWDSLFTHFNFVHGNGEVGYQPGEKIAIKVNLNNCYQAIDYIIKDNDRDASPHIVKALLRQLVNVLGVAQEDITIYDASRPIPNWFYRRVYYESFPALLLIPEFPNVHYADQFGLMLGREKVQPSDEKIHFADGTGLTMTLPTCVTNAKYLINIPILKRHPINYGVTLSGKNYFGTWIEPVWDVHDYHESGFTAGNPTPQTDLFAHEHIGGKTFLYLGDGLYATKQDHRTIAKFHMYPFNNDWTNSLFFSQDPVAIDSVMYDFLHAEGTNPIEGSQNYLHESAVPLPNTYDPENDGIYLSESLGVHEHWNKSFDIFSAERYVGPSENGIDFITIGNEHAGPGVMIISPKTNHLYINGQDIIRTRRTIVIGDILVEAKANSEVGGVDYIEFYLDDTLQHTDDSEPYEWFWGRTPGLKHTIKVMCYGSEPLSHEIVVWKLG